MLETIHEYARERLAQSGEADDFRARHAIYFLALAERAEVGLQGAGQEYWYARLKDELDNIRTAINWTLDGADVELGARLVAALRDLLYFTGLLLSESATWIDRVLESKERISPAVRAKALNTYSRVTYARGDFADAILYERDAIELAGGEEAPGFEDRRARLETFKAKRPYTEGVAPVEPREPNPRPAQ